VLLSAHGCLLLKIASVGWQINILNLRKIYLLILQHKQTEGSNGDAQSNKTIAFDDTADIETLVKQLDLKKDEADKAKQEFLAEAMFFC